MSSDNVYLASPTVPICRLEIHSHFESLAERERMYAHHIGRASWAGSRIVLQQVSAESVDIYDLVLSLYGRNDETASAESLALAAGVSSNDYAHWLSYCVQFLGNLGNYKSFGDTKFIPRIPAATVERICRALGGDAAATRFQKVAAAMFSLEPASVLRLAHGNSTYYGAGVTTDEVTLVQEFLESRHLNAYNTRVFKNGDVLQVRLASAVVTPPQEHTHKGRHVLVETGDYQPQMRAIVAELQAAIAYAANENQRKMLEKYVESFSTGSIDAHKDSQRYARLFGG